MRRRFKQPSQCALKGRAQAVCDPCAGLAGKSCSTIIEHTLRLRAYWVSSSPCMQSQSTPAVSMCASHGSCAQVPPTLKFILDGEMPPHLMAKDLILQIIGEIGVAGATYKCALLLEGRCP